MAYSAPVGSPEELLKRFDRACARREDWVSHWSDCYRYALPQRELFYEHTKGQRKNLHIYDSTAIEAVSEFAARIQANLTPPWRNWSRLAPGPLLPPEYRDDAEIATTLDEATETLFGYLHHSNFDLQAHEAFTDLSVGTCCLQFEEGPLGEDLFQFTAIPLVELVIEEGPFGSVQTTWRKRKIPARVIRQEWPKADIPGRLERIMRDKPDEPVELIVGIVFHEKSRNYWLVVIDKESKHFIYTENMGIDNPMIVARWMVIAGEIYGRGPVMNALPDIKTLNKVVELALAKAAMDAFPPLLAMQGGGLNPYTLRLQPNTVIPVQSTDARNPSLVPLQTSGNFDLAMFILEDMRNRVKQMLHNDLRAPVHEGPVKSATEVAIADRDFIQQIGASFGRLQREFVEPIIQRAVDILVRNGKIDLGQISDRVDGEILTLKHTSPLARAQDTEELLAFRQYQEALAAIPVPGYAALVQRLHEIPAYLAQKTGFPEKLLKPADDIESEMEALKQAAAAAQTGAMPGAGS